MNYLLLGAVFLGIGAQASTVREVQTLSMPVTMAQVLIFGFAAPRRLTRFVRGAGRRGLPLVLAAGDDRPRRRGAGTVAPFAALLWQSSGSALILRFGARLFRKTVLKSGPRRRRWLSGARRFKPEAQKDSLAREKTICSNVFSAPFAGTGHGRSSNPRQRA